MNDLFVRVGFVDTYYSEMVSFYRDYFCNEEDLNNFFLLVFENDNVNKFPRKIMNQVARWVGLAEDMQKVHPDRDPLTVLCVRACIESITTSKKDFFDRNLSPDGRNYIENNFQVINIYDENGKEIDNFDEMSVIQEFEEMLFRVRSEAVHDGDYWSSQVFARSKDVWWVSMYRYEKKTKSVFVTYKTKIERDLFLKYFVEAAINYIKAYVDSSHP